MQSTAPAAWKLILHSSRNHSVLISLSKKSARSSMDGEKELKLRVLAVDDDPQMLQVIAGALEDLQIELLKAGTGEAALELFKEMSPQVVLTDLRLEAMDGMELLERIVKLDPGCDVILVTGHYTTESAVEAIQ